MTESNSIEISPEDYEILFVDDDKQILDIVEQYLTRMGYRLSVANSAKKALAILKERDIDIVFTDLVMPNMDGIALLKAIKAKKYGVEVIVVTGHGTLESAIKAFKSGSYDYLQKPLNFQRLRILIDRVLEKKHLQKENKLIKKRLNERYKYDDMVGISSKMQDIYKIIDRISLSNPNVLIQGESGTGKELVAKIIHQNSKRKNKPFIPVNCGAISESLLESELFGHVKGAFTGAIRKNIGLFKAADGGTIFLDEIAEITPKVQVKLLRVLQERTLRAVGDTHEKEVDVRVLAATNRNLDDAIKNKRLRKDLYYRLNVISVRTPPLRTVKEDIPFLVNHFLNRYNTKKQKKIYNVSPGAMEILLGYDWPGNVRQLENVIERAFALGAYDTIRVEDLPPEIIDRKQDVVSEQVSYSLEENEIMLIKKALFTVKGNKAEAAKLLGINLSTVYRKMEKHRISDKPFRNLN